MAQHNIEKLVDNKGGQEHKSRKNFLRQHIQNLEREAAMRASTSTDEKLEAYRVLAGRYGSAASGSTIPLTGDGLLGGSGESPQEGNKEIYDKYRANLDEWRKKEIDRWNIQTDGGRNDIGGGHYFFIDDLYRSYIDGAKKEYKISSYDSCLD